jgi:hypothetical protein
MAQYFQKFNNRIPPLPGRSILKANPNQPHTVDAPLINWSFEDVGTTFEGSSMTVK